MKLVFNSLATLKCSLMNICLPVSNEKLTDSFFLHFSLTHIILTLQCLAYLAYPRSIHLRIPSYTKPSTLIKKRNRNGQLRVAGTSSSGQSIISNDNGTIKFIFFH